jgi:hypothetical protein
VKPVAKSTAKTAAVKAAAVEPATMEAAAVEATATVETAAAMGCLGGDRLGHYEDSRQSGCSKTQMACYADALHVGLLLYVAADSGVHEKKIGAHRGRPLAAG